MTGISAHGHCFQGQVERYFRYFVVSIDFCFLGVCGSGGLPLFDDAMW